MAAFLYQPAVTGGFFVFKEDFIFFILKNRRIREQKMKTATLFGNIEV